MRWRGHALYLIRCDEELDNRRGKEPDFTLSAPMFDGRLRLVLGAAKD
jgi:hypothetical protein